MKKANYLILAANLIALPLYAQSTDYSIGAGVGIQQSIYKGIDNTTSPFPLVGYEGEHFFIQGVTAGYQLRPASASSNLIFKVMYDFKEFDPSDSDNAQMQLLNKRDNAVMAGVGYKLKTAVGIFQADALTDVSDEHNGSSTRAMWTIPFPNGRWGFNTTVGYNYSNGNYNNYYYGVSAQESVVSGLASYDLDWAGSFFTNIQSYWMLTQNLSVGGGITYTLYDDEISDSPMVDDDETLGVNMSVTYRF
ncbi:MipA/OmpV family protein [Vibrio quintilis]|uniref:MltA-interacting protein n=1 Tax=Vibrio quintilis TaxID=1117707 RepID=A0A1M7YPP1_9VIBR|nr:MipA/OmpV family protein [Vibrio quintilis]SHO54603.1 MltA-interacting protein precursor [Vibrio quintilis]